MDLQPFWIAGELASIENYMWDYSCKTAMFSTSLMRGMFQYLFTSNGTLMMESLYPAELSDFCDFIFHQKQERDPYQCSIIRVGAGKVN